MPQEVRVGFIGCGGNARGHMNRLRQLPDTRIVAFCDVAEPSAQAAAAETGAGAYTDHRRMLEREDLDAVYISIPVFAHGRPELDTIERRLPFLVEKPVAIDMETAREIEAALAASGVMAAVGYQLRYAGTVDLAREVLAGKTVGLVGGRYWCNSGAGDPSHWLRQMARSGGQLLEQATHTIDIMRCLAGEVEEVYAASTRRVLSGIDCPDFNAVALRFASGAVGTLTTSWAYAQGWGNTNVVDMLFDDAALTWTHGRLTVYRDGAVEEHTPPAVGVDEVFLEAVRAGDDASIRSPYPDAVRSLAVSLAMNRSAAEGRPVRIDEMG